MKKYERFTIRAKATTVLRCEYCSRKRFCHEIAINARCGHEAIDRLAKLEDLIDGGKLIFVDADDDEIIQIKVSRSWLKEMYKILQEKDIDC